MKRTLVPALALAVLAACGTKIPPPTYPAWGEKAEAEYAPYLVEGTSEISGQAFLAQKGGGTVKAAGRTVTLDPTTEISSSWWQQAGKVWKYRAATPPSAGFMKARRTTTADADGRFIFSNVPAGSYFMRTEITWEVPYHGIQGGLVTSTIEVKAGEKKQMILNGTN